MAPTLASIAAPSPAQQQAAQPTTTPAARKESAKEKAAIDRGLQEVRVERVRVDGLALMKIIKHSRDAHAVLPAPSGTSNATVGFSPAVGQLLGLDANGTLEISNVFGLPSGALGGQPTRGEDANDLAAGATGESRGIKAATKYTSTLLPRLADLNADASLVGFYTSSNNGQHLAIPGFVEALVGAQLTGGGIGSASQAHKPTPVGRVQPTKATLPSGTGTKSAKGIALVYDVASAGQGHVGLRAFRLSSAFIEAYREGKFDTRALIEHKVVPTNILEEIPVVVHSNALLSAFLSTLVTPSTSSASGSSTSTTLPFSNLAVSRAPAVAATSSFATLSLPTSSSAQSAPAPLTAPISALLTSLETHSAHLSTLSFQTRQLARERARVESLPSSVRRRAENEQRAKDGLAPLPLTSEELAVEREPSRLDTMLALAGVEGAAQSLAAYTGTGAVRSFGSKAAATA
ncbi:hypothetical protein T439DRAFT_326013 [Meredithblackwellia eburnea MCA 4105]